MTISKMATEDKKIFLSVAAQALTGIPSDSQYVPVLNALRKTEVQEAQKAFLCIRQQDREDAYGCLLTAVFLLLHGHFVSAEQMASLACQKDSSNAAFGRFRDDIRKAGSTLFLRKKRRDDAQSSVDREEEASSCGIAAFCECCECCMEFS